MTELVMDAWTENPTVSRMCPKRRRKAAETAKKAAETRGEAP